VSDYEWHDFWTTSAMEGCRNAYQKAINKVEDALDSAQADLSQLRSEAASYVSAFYGSGDPSGGPVVTDFNAAVARWHSQVDGLISVDPGEGLAAWYLKELDAKLATMRTRLQILQQKCADEDAARKELPLSALPF
jgi:hypothetical protein